MHAYLCNSTTLPWHGESPSCKSASRQPYKGIWRCCWQLLAVAGLRMCEVAFLNLPLPISVFVGIFIATWNLGREMQMNLGFICGYWNKCSKYTRAFLVLTKNVSSL